MRKSKTKDSISSPKGRQTSSEPPSFNSDQTPNTHHMPYVSKHYEDMPLPENCKGSFKTYEHEIIITLDQLYEFQNISKSTFPQENRRKMLGSLPNNFSSFSLRKFISSISPSGRKKSNLKRELSLKSTTSKNQDKNDSGFVSKETPKSKDKRFLIRRDFSLRSFSK